MMESIGNKNSMQRNRLLIWSVIILAIVFSGLALLLPSPESWPSNEAPFHQVLIGDVIMASTYLGAALLFLTNLDVYTSKLRRAYRILALGVSIAGIATLHVTLLTAFNAWSTPYAQSGIAVVPFLLSGLIMYAGVRSFVDLLQVRHILRRAELAIPAAAVCAFLATFIPHPVIAGLEESAYDILMGLGVWSGLLIIFAGVLIVRVRQQTGEAYVNAMGWLAAALFFSGFVLIGQATYEVMKVGYDLLLDTLMNVVIVASGLVWIRAAYAFALTKYGKKVPMVKMLFSWSEEVSSRAKTVIDMVVSTAALVSNSRDVDPLLDKLRMVTVKLNPGEQPSVEDRTELVKTYLNIEDYLVNREPIRHYTRQELRRRLDPALVELVMRIEKQQVA